MAKKDYYEILGVKKTDSIDTIKKSYKKLALKYHPDKASESKKKEYEEKFKEINEAHSTLSNEEKRKNYDMGGQNQFGGFNRNSGFGAQDFSEMFQDLFDSDSFGGRRDSQELQDLHYNISISFIEAAFGCEKELLIRKNILCNVCDGTGAKDNQFNNCEKCNGQGKLNVRQRTPWGTINRTVICDDCNGEGKTAKNKCENCKGEGIISSKETMKIKIPKGIDNGQTLRIGQGGNAIKGGQKGDLFLTIQIKPDKIFKRENFDIFMEFPISFSQAALGCKISIPTLNGEGVKIKIKKGIETGEILRLKGKGIPFLDDPYFLGDQYIKIIVKTPKKLNKAQTKLFKKLLDLDE